MALESKADMQLAEHRAYIERRERDHQKELDKLQMDFERQLRLHSDLIGKIITLDVKVMEMEMLCCTKRKKKKKHLENERMEK